MEVRHARAADLRSLAALEESGTALYASVFGDLTGDALASPAPRGGDRLDRPGFLLVAGPVGAPVGFAHVLVLDGCAHLDQVSVHPDAGRRGIGTRIVLAAMREAYLGGHDRLSLTTYRDVAWNGPFYARLGFTVVEQPEPFQRRLRRAERRAGLDAHGPRVVMSVPLSRKLLAGHLACGA